MKRPIPYISIALLWCLTTYAEVRGQTPASQKTPLPIAIAKLEPNLDRREVTIRFTVSELGGVAQRSIPGKAPSFIIEATSEHDRKDLTVWIEGELADVLDRLQLSYAGSNPLKKGTVITATGLLTFSPGAGDRKGHEWYALQVQKWQNFRVVSPERSR